MRFSLCLALFAMAALAQPRIFFSDLDGGPRTGGENNLGAFVTIYGTGFGSARGAGVVTVGGGAVVAYPVWSDNKVTFQLGGAAATGEIRLSNGAGTSNGVPFAVRAGNIYFVGPSGADGNSGSLAAPWRTVQRAVDGVAPGDIIYLLNGTTAVRGGTSDGSVTLSRNNGAAGRPKALVAYPGATASIGQVAGGPCASTACVEGLRTTYASDYWTIAGLRLAGNDYALAMRGRGWRVVGNDLTCPFGSGASACLDASQTTLASVYGNVVHDVGYNRSSDLYHGVYFSTDSTNIDLGWNTVSNVQGCRGIQFNSTALDNVTGFNQYALSVHDNLITGTQCDGIVFSTVDPSQGAITVYNNVIVDAGRGPATFEGGGTFSCVYAAGYRGSRSGPGSGTIDVYNNTMVNCGGFQSVNGFGGVTYARRDTTIDVRLRNNIIVQNNGSPYWVNYDGGDQGLTGSNNLVFGNGAPAGAGPFGTIVADPIFLNPAAGDFRIATNSPARAAGVNTGLATDKSGVARGAAPDIGAYQAVAGTGGGAPPVGAGQLVVSAVGIDVTGVQGSDAAPQVFTVGNVGQQSLDFNITSTQVWARPTPATGTLTAGAGRAVTVALSTAALPVGVNTAVLRVTGGGAQRDVTVRVTVNPAGGAQVVISASASAFEFSTSDAQEAPAPQAFVLRNAGTVGAAASWSSLADKAWLSLFPNAGYLSSAGQNVRLDVNPSGLSTGTHVALVTIRSDAALNSPVVLTVRLTIGAATGGSSLVTVSPSVIDLAVTVGSNPEARLVSVTNTSQQAVDASASADQPWMQAITPGGFGFLLPGASQTVTLTFNAAQLSAGLHTGTLRIGSGASQRDVPVRLTVNPVFAAPPGLSVDMDNFNFVSLDAGGEAPAAQVVRLRHGGGRVNWTSSSNQAWLTLAPNAGVVDAAGQEIRLQVNPTGLTAGSYVALVQLSSVGAVNSPQRLTVRLTVGGGGGGTSLSVSPSLLEVQSEQGGDASPQSMFVSNTGTATSFTVTAEPSWLRVSPASGFLAAGGGQALALSFASAGLAPGVHAGVVRVTGGGVQREATVRLTVTAGGLQRLVASTDSFNFAMLEPGNDGPMPQSFRLRNGGAGAMNWSSRASQAWVSLSPNAGSVSPQGVDVAVTVNPSGLPAGSHVATVTLTGSSGAPVVLTVRLSIGGGSNDGGALVASPAALELTSAPGASIGSQSVLIRNNGSQSFNYTASADQPWILVAPASGLLFPGNSQTLTVNFNAAVLSAGTHLGSIRVQGGGVERTIGIRLTVGSGGGGAVAGFSVSADTFQFVHRSEADEPPAAQTFRLNNSTGAQVNWTSRADQAWVTLSPNAGYLSPAGQAVALVVNPSGLPQGSHTANVTIQIAGVATPLRLTVRLTVGTPFF